MGNERNLASGQAEAFVKYMEDQGCRVRQTKNGYMVYAPSGATASVHTSLGDVRGVKNDIATFRRVGIHHPADPRPLIKETEMVEKNEEGYPLYLTKPITGTTRKAVLADLESKGWPLVVRPTDLAMDSTTAARALYNVGYRWGDDGTDGKRNRSWHAPDEIQDLHHKARAEAERREQEARDRRREMRVLPSIRDRAIDTIRDLNAAADGEHSPRIPTPREVAEAIEQGRGHEVTIPFQLSPEVTDTPSTIEQTYQNPGKTIAESADPGWLTENTKLQEDIVKPEREFVDDVDSWTVNEDHRMPSEVRFYLEQLRGAGLQAEIRVWRS